MNTEHTNQSRQAEPATHSPIALQSIPKRQCDFTAENIRDIAHECMRIGDNEQAEVIFAIADALRDGNLTIHPAAVAVRIRELEAQLNAATHARQEAQQIAQEAIEARNRAGVEIRRPLLKRIRELQAQQAEPANQQLLALVKSFGHKTGCAKNAFGEQCTCGADEVIAAAEQAPQAAVAAPLPPYNVFSDDDGDSWREHPADADFVEGLQLGDEFELLAGWRSVRVTFRVTKVPDDENDDYEVEEVTAPAAAQKGGTA